MSDPSYRSSDYKGLVLEVAVSGNGARDWRIVVHVWLNVSFVTFFFGRTDCDLEEASAFGEWVGRKIVDGQVPGCGLEKLLAEVTGHSGLAHDQGPSEPKAP